MAPFIEGDKILTDKERYEVVRSTRKYEYDTQPGWETCYRADSLHVIPDGDCLSIEVFSGIRSKSDRNALLGAQGAQIALKPKQGIQIGEKKIEWRDDPKDNSD